MTLRIPQTGILILTAALLLAPVARAVPLTESFTFNVPLTYTNWGDPVGSVTLDLSKFDPTLGNLLSIQFDLTGTAQGDAEVENKSLTAATVTTDLSAVITLMRPDTSVITNVIPLASTSELLGAFDGVKDYGGASGRSYANLQNTQTVSFTTNTASDRALFTGAGLIHLPITAHATSAATGAGGLSFDSNTYASASATLTYTYDTATPEPALGFGTALALLGMGVSMRRRAA